MCVLLARIIMVKFKMEDGTNLLQKCNLRFWVRTMFLAVQIVNILR